MSSDRQLFSRLPKGMALPWHVSFDGKVNTRDAENLPFIYWPNRVPCLEANAYMISLLQKGLSRRNRGGTIAEYAKNISPLLRFCYVNGLKLIDLTDNYFTLFIRGLQALSVEGEKQRSCNEVIKIGRRCIDFLFYLADFHSSDNIIGEVNCSITVNRKEFTMVSKSNRKFRQKYWAHESFPDPDPVLRRHPISNDVVKALKKTAGNIKDKGLRLRKELMIACFEQTGGRREEVANIRIKDIEAANRSTGSVPLLWMETLKKGNDRFLPVPRVFIQLAMKYIKRVRRRIIRNKLGRANDHGFLFISHTQGTRLTTDTLTTELSKLCVAAGVDDQPGHAHLFRHAYITQKFVVTILQYDINNKDEFRKALLSTSAIKLDIQQWTGHKSLNSLDTYIDLAFYEIGHMSRVHNAISLKAAVGVAMDRIGSLEAEAKVEHATLSELMEDFKDLIGAFRRDIEAADQYDS
jgi:integrase